MSKGQYKRQYTDGTPRFMRWGRFLAIILILALMVGGLLYIYRDKAEPIKQSFGLQVQKIKLWLLVHKQKQNQTPKKATSTTTPETNDQDDVHFEFYTTLQTMRVNTPAPVNKEDKKPASLKHIFVSSDELEKEFSSKLKGKSQ